MLDSIVLQDLDDSVHYGQLGAHVGGAGVDPLVLLEDDDVVDGVGTVLYFHFASFLFCSIFV